MLAPLLAATALAAPTFTSDQPCYVAGKQMMQFSGQGWTPNGKVNLLFLAGGKFGSFETTADAAGAVSVGVRAPTFDFFDEDPPSFNLSMTANDEAKFGPDGPIGPPEETFAALALKITEWDATVDAFTKAVRPGQRVKVVTTGWVGEGDTLYVHYRRGGKTVRSEKLAKLKGPCGDLTKNFKAFSFKNAKPGQYSVRFSTSPKFSNGDRWTGYTVRLTS